MALTPNIIALIPARAGSKRVPGKNIRFLGEHPLLAYTIAAAIESQIFSTVVVSTDAEDIADIARYYGAEVPFLRPAQFAADQSPDIDWIDDALRQLQAKGQEFDCFSILRPTSPFRQPQTIQRAWQVFLEQKQVDSLRAVEKCKQHPGKMWVLQGDLMQPLLTGDGISLSSQNSEFTIRPNARSKAQNSESKKVPWHSTPYQALPAVYTQNASLEIAWCRVVLEDGTIAGEKIMPFLTQGYEGIDINDPKDWWYVEYLLQQGEAQLPNVPQTAIEF